MTRTKIFPKHRWTGRQRSRRGVSIIELALMLPVMVLLVFGFIETGWYLHSMQLLQHAAGQGARAAVRVDNSNAEVASAVNSVLGDSISLSTGAVTVLIEHLNDEGAVTYTVQSLDDNERGESVRVTASLSYSLMSPPTDLLGIIPSTISASAVMQRAN